MMGNLSPVYEDVQTEYDESCEWPWYKLVPPSEAKTLFPWGWKSRDLGHIYFVVLSNGFVKIGSTKGPKRRVREHLTALHKFTNLEVESFYFTAPHTNYRQNEKKIHALLRNQFVAGNQSEVYANMTIENAKRLFAQCKLEHLTWVPKSELQAA